ncbi:MAG: hypothetical protein K9J81_01440 [Desulfohalobiaceae bacterium]|nr:hypothetical protein [Desulfohalobiaceae bacterium]
MAKGTVHAGICGFVTVIEAQSTDSGAVDLKISSDCPNIQKVADELLEIEPYDEIFKRVGATRTVEVMSKHSPHPACPVTCGILKTIEVAAGLALPQEAGLRIER